MAITFLGEIGRTSDANANTLQVPVSFDIPRSTPEVARHVIGFHTLAWPIDGDPFDYPAITAWGDEAERDPFYGTCYDSANQGGLGHNPWNGTGAYVQFAGIGPLSIGGYDADHGVHYEGLSVFTTAVLHPLFAGVDTLTLNFAHNFSWANVIWLAYEGMHARPSEFDLPRLFVSSVAAAEGTVLADPGFVKNEDCLPMTRDWSESELILSSAFAKVAATDEKTGWDWDDAGFTERLFVDYDTGIEYGGGSGQYTFLNHVVGSKTITPPVTGLEVGGCWTPSHSYADPDDPAELVSGAIANGYRSGPGPLRCPVTVSGASMFEAGATEREPTTHTEHSGAVLGRTSFKRA